MLRIDGIKLKAKDDEATVLLKKIYMTLKCRNEDMTEWHILKKSIDSRKTRNGEQCLHIVYSVAVKLTHEEIFLKKCSNPDIKPYKPVICELPAAADIIRTRRKNNNGKRPIVCGSGPAGLFCAYFLARAGLNPIILERGKDVDQRSAEVDKFFKTGILNPETNVQFGEGGAGTFSDGKLNTTLRDDTGRIRTVLETFVKFGAPEEILYLSKPHIGTDLLKNIIKNMRKEIISLGGEFRFENRLSDVLIDNGMITGVNVANASGNSDISCDTLILATGHSSRDTFRMLYKAGLFMEKKAFAIGVRIEHDQKMIDFCQYHLRENSAALEAYNAGKLPPADYRVTYNTLDAKGVKRGVYSFCMCPGGFVVNASSQKGYLTVNGMSNYKRNGRNANSAIVISVTPDDFAGTPGYVDSPLAGICFQDYYEKKAYESALGKIPVQLYGDFKQKRISKGYGHITPAHMGENAFADINKILPGKFSELLKDGIQSFDRTIPGFADEEAVLSGLEMRTSSPLRILRDETMQSSVKGIYPAGEGAGYAGGITSAAADGIKVAEILLARE